MSKFEDLVNETKEILIEHINDKSNRPDYLLDK